MNCDNRDTLVNNLERQSMIVEELNVWNQDSRMDIVVCDDKPSWYSGSGG